MRIQNEQSVFENPKYVTMIAIFCAVLWGSAFPVLKISYEELNITSADIYTKILFAGMRFFIASVMLFGFLALRAPKSMKIEKKYIPNIFLLGLLQTSLQYFFFYNGLSNTTGIKGAILASSGTFFVIVLSHFIYSDDKMSKNKVIGILLGFLGIVLVNKGKSLDMNFTFMGEGFLILAGLVSSFGTIMAKKLSLKINTMALTCYQMFMGSIMLLMIGYLGAEKSLDFNLLTGSLLLYAAFLSACAFALWYTLLKHNKAGEITMFKFMIPVSGSILSALFISGESFSSGIIIAMVMVSMGIIAVNRK